MNSELIKEVELALFRVLVQLHEKSNIEIKDLLKGDLESNLKMMQSVDEELSIRTNSFFNLPKTIQWSAIASLEMRIREYCKVKGIQY